MDDTLPILALSIRQPWAQLIVSGMVMLDSVKRTPNAPDAYTFTLSHARRFTDPIPGRGQRGLYQPSAAEWELLKGKAEKYMGRSIKES